MLDNNQKVAVTGMGCISALGMNVDACMSQMFEGVRHIGAPKKLLTDHLVKYPVFELSDQFKTLVPKKWQGLSQTAQMGIIVANQALEQAGIDHADLKNMRVGVCMGSTVGCTLNHDSFYIDYRDKKQPNMDPIKRYLNSNPAASIARAFKIDGPLQTVVNACSSGTDAIGIGTSWIESGLCDLVIAGGTDELCKVTYNGFISLMITDESPCKPFDKNRNGLNLGEGAAAVILESFSSISRRKKAPRCFVEGYGFACDAYHLTAPEPSGVGLKKAIKEALAKSGIDPSDPSEIGFINAHGTATKDNDRVEALTFSSLLPNIPFLSTKGYTGHTLGAAGAIEAVFTIYCLNVQKIPKSIGYSEKDEALDVVPVVENQEISCRAAMSNSVAFGGNNSVLIFSES